MIICYQTFVFNPRGGGGVEWTTHKIRKIKLDHHSVIIVITQKLIREFYLNLDTIFVATYSHQLKTNLCLHFIQSNRKRFVLRKTVKFFSNHFRPNTFVKLESF
jgi:hypothetical protein